MFNGSSDERTIEWRDIPVSPHNPPFKMASAKQESAPTNGADNKTAGTTTTTTTSPDEMKPPRVSFSRRPPILPSDASMREVFEFSNLDISYEWERSIFVHIWNFCFGLFALADFSAAMAKQYVFIEPTSDALFDRAILWLTANSNSLGILFSLLWFMDAFVEAHQKRMKAARKRDKAKLLSGEDACEDWWRGSRGVYYRTMSIQILLLPVGFFVFCYNRARQLNDPLVGDDDVVIVAHQIHDEVDESETFSSHASVSLGFAVVKHLLITLSDYSGSRIRLHGVAKIKSMAFRTVWRGIRHPIRFYRRIRKSLRLVRWVKYLAPLIGTGNKLKGNVSDLVKKYRQHRQAEMAKTVRRKLWDLLSEKELREYCATLIQKTFRAHQARKKLLIVNLMKGKSDLVASIKLQSAFRGFLARARYRVKDKFQQLQELKEKEKKDGKTEMSVDERRRMYTLQQELEDEAQSLINEKLLLRPNTTFAVAWKILFVTAVIFEMSILACKPMLKKHRDPVTGKPLDIESILDKTLIPTPISKLPSCIGSKSLKFSIAHPVRSLRILVNRIRNKIPEVKEERPWYCGEAYSTIQSAYIAVADIAIHHFLVIVGIICFCDVFVVFFTGQYNEETGALEPRPFFQRWILPGLLLQLLVNPNMEEVSKVVFGAIDGLLHHGPFRVLRWTVALFFPVCLWFFRRMRGLWCTYTTNQNQKLVQDQRNVSVATTQGPSAIKNT